MIVIITDDMRGATGKLSIRFGFRMGAFKDLVYSH